MLITLFGMVTEVKLLQLAKAHLPILFPLLGIVIEVKPVPENAPVPMLVTELGMVTEVNPIQPAKPVILATLSGISTEVKPVQS